MEAKARKTKTAKEKTPLSPKSVGKNGLKKPLGRNQGPILRGEEHQTAHRRN